MLLGLEPRRSLARPPDPIPPRKTMPQGLIGLCTPTANKEQERLERVERREAGITKERDVWSRHPVASPVPMSPHGANIAVPVDVVYINVASADDPACRCANTPRAR